MNAVWLTIKTKTIFKRMNRYRVMVTLCSLFFMTVYAVHGQPRDPGSGAAFQVDFSRAFAQGGQLTQPAYTVFPRVTVYRTADSLRPIATLALRQSVEVVDYNYPRNWLRIRTADGREGFVKGHTISNVWIRVSKSRRTLWVYAGSEVLRTYPVDLGHNAVADKEQRGSELARDHWRTPEGTFFIGAKNTRSNFYRALMLNYPTVVHARRGLERGLINQRQFNTIEEAESSFQLPPMHTPLGGMIAIHGHGTGLQQDWTQGCVALTNAQMDDLWSFVHVGTPVIIEP